MVYLHKVDFSLNFTSIFLFYFKGSMIKRQETGAGAMVAR